MPSYLFQDAGHLSHIRGLGSSGLTAPPLRLPVRRRSRHPLCPGALFCPGAAASASQRIIWMPSDGTGRLKVISMPFYLFHDAILSLPAAGREFTKCILSLPFDAILYLSACKSRCHLCVPLLYSGCTAGEGWPRQQRYQNPPKAPFPRGKCFSCTDRRIWSRSARLRQMFFSGQCFLIRTGGRNPGREGDANLQIKFAFPNVYDVSYTYQSASDKFAEMLCSKSASGICRGAPLSDRRCLPFM